ncbi:MAG: hypothetical protein ACR2MD_05825 [Aridibacter sp.]
MMIYSKQVYFLITTTLLFMFADSINAQTSDETKTLETKKETTISICNLPVPKGIKQANASFTVNYIFELEKDGKPKNLVKVRDRYVGIKNVSACLNDWRINVDSKDEKMVVNFRWEHGIGWTQILVLNTEYKYVINIKDGIGY